MKVRRVTLEIEVPWNAEYETALLNKTLDGAGLLLALDKGLGNLYDLTWIPYQAQVIKEEVSANKMIGVTTEWPPK
jgi:hypothetical protein